MMFSIIIPCYNAKTLLRKCLDSILAQHFDDFEIIAIDDGSTDGSEAILDNYSSKYSNFYVYHFKNAGVSYSRKRGILLANGNYVIFVDSDDTINPNLLANLYEIIKSHNFPDLIRYQSNLINDSPYKDHQRYNFNSSLNVILDGINALKLWSCPGKKYAVYWLFAFKKTLFSNILFVTHLRCYKDVALIPILIATSKKVITINYVGYNYLCNNADSLTNNKSIEAERSRAIDFLEAYKYAIQNFIKLDNVSNLDIAFFVEDYTRRLNGKYNSLPDILKSELADYYKL